MFKKIFKNILMKKKIVFVGLILTLLVFCASACEQQTNTYTLTELLTELETLPQLTADGEIYISIHDRGMEEDFEQENLPVDLLQDASIKYHINFDNQAKLFEANLVLDFACYDKAQECTLFIDSEYFYVKTPDFLNLYKNFAEPDEYAEAEALLADYDWLAWPLDPAFAMFFYNSLDEDELQICIDEANIIRDTIGKAYAGFSTKALVVKGNSFALELDNAGLAELINEFVEYTLYNFEEIARACIEYINCSKIFEQYEREAMVESIQEILDTSSFEVPDWQLEYIREEVNNTLINECPMDFAMKYLFAKTAKDTYVWDEEFNIIFDEEYYGESSDVLISTKNTFKAVNNLQITIPTENVSYADEL